MVFIYWLMLLEVFLIKCFNLFFLFRNYMFMYITNTLLGFTSTRFLALEKELFCQLALEGDSVEGFLHWLQRICRLGSLNMMY